MRHQLAQVNVNSQPYNPRATEQVPLPNVAAAAAAGSGWTQPNNNKFMSSRRFSVNPNFRRGSLRDRVSAACFNPKVILVLPSSDYVSRPFPSISHAPQSWTGSPVLVKRVDVLSALAVIARIWNISLCVLLYRMKVESRTELRWTGPLLQGLWK